MENPKQPIPNEPPKEREITKDEQFWIDHTAHVHPISFHFAPNYLDWVDIEVYSTYWLLKAPCVDGVSYKDYGDFTAIKIDNCNIKYAIALRYYLKRISKLLEDEQEMYRQYKAADDMLKMLKKMEQNNGK